MSKSGVSSKQNNKRVHSSKEGLQQAATLREQAASTELEARLLRISHVLTKTPLFVGAVEKLLADNGVDLESIAVDACAAPDPKKIKKVVEKAVDNDLDIPRSATYWGAVSADRLVAYLCELETFFSVESLSVLKPMTSNNKRRVRNWPRQPLADLIEFLTGVHKDIYLGTTGPLHIHASLVRGLRQLNENLGKRGQNLRLPPDWTRDGVYEVAATTRPA
eukprot:4777386-Amphidinium_carterae.1